MWRFRFISLMVHKYLLHLQLPRPIFDAAVQWAMKADKTSFWRTHRRGNPKPSSPRESVISIRKSGGVITRNKSEESAFLHETILPEVLTTIRRDEAHLAKLQQLGMTPSEESKLVAMREHIVRLANNTSRWVSFQLHIICVAYPRCLAMHHA